MSDDMIRRGDVIAALKAATLPFGYGQAVHAITNVPTVQVTVKPLEWLEIRPGQYFEARVIGILYSVRLGTDGIARWQAGHMGAWREANTLEAAKAAAQADYAARIRSALTAVPSPDVAGLVRALVAEYVLMHPLETEAERIGRRSAIRGIAVRMGCYPQLDTGIDAAIARVKGGE